MPQQTALAAAIASAGATSLTVDDVLGFPASGEYTALIGLEALRVTAGAGTTTWTVTRGYLSTTAATHADNSTVTLVEDAPISLAAYRAWASITDTTDDAWLTTGADAFNRAVRSAVGVDLGPSVDTTRYYDGRDAVRDGTRLWVPGGIRTFLTVAISYDAQATWTTITADVRIGPVASQRPYGEPGSYVEFVYAPTTASRFPSGTADVRLTCTTLLGFGWAAWPEDIVQDALSGLQRMAMDRNRSGGSPYPNETNAMRYLSRDLLRGYRAMSFPGVG